jgi:hypothetical protein
MRRTSKRTHSNTTELWENCGLGVHAIREANAWERWLQSLRGGRGTAAHVKHERRAGRDEATPGAASAVPKLWWDDQRALPALLHRWAPLRITGQTLPAHGEAPLPHAD